MWQNNPKSKHNCQLNVTKSMFKVFFNFFSHKIFDILIANQLLNEQKENNKKSTDFVEQMNRFLATNKITNTKIQNKIETIKFNANERYEME